MDSEEDEVNLHYHMLEFVYQKQILPASCFNYVWEDFKNQQDEFADQITSSKLKFDLKK